MITQVPLSTAETRRLNASMILDSARAGKIVAPDHEEILEQVLAHYQHPLFGIGHGFTELPEGADKKVLCTVEAMQARRIGITARLNGSGAYTRKQDKFSHGLFYPTKVKDYAGAYILQSCFVAYSAAGIS